MCSLSVWSALGTQGIECHGAAAINLFPRTCTGNFRSRLVAPLSLRGADSGQAPNASPRLSVWPRTCWTEARRAEHRTRSAGSSFSWEGHRRQDPRCPCHPPAGKFWVTSLLGLRFLISKARGKVNQMTRKSPPLVTRLSETSQNECPYLTGPYIPYELH